MTKNNPTEKQIEAKIKNIKACAMKTDRRENVKFIVTLQGQIYVINYNFLSECFFWTSVIYKVFVAGFEHVFICWKRYSTKTFVVLALPSK